MTDTFHFDLPHLIFKEVTLFSLKEFVIKLKEADATSDRR